MKLLINGFHELSQFQMVKELVSNLKIEELHWITTEACEENVFEQFPSVKILVWEKLFWGISDKSSLGAAKPLGEDRLALYRECESVALKMMDRFCFRRDYSYLARKQAFLDYLRFWEGYLDEYPIDFFISQNVPHEVFDYVLLEVCKQRGIKTLMFYQSQLSDCIVPMQCFDKKVLGLENAMKDSLYDAAGEEDKKYIENDITAILDNKMPFYMKRNSLLKKGVQEIQRITGKAKASKDYFYKRLSISYLAYKFELEKRRIRLRRATRKLNRAYRKSAASVNSVEPYIYLALHYQPELTTCPLAGAFVDQGLIIDLLSKAAPENVKIYVKEHPKQTAIGRDLLFYERYSNLPNVRFVPFEYSSFRLMDESLCVATCTGTAGWEALVRGKQVLVFGNIFFEDAPGAHRIKNLEDLKKAFGFIMNEKSAVDHRAAIKNYMAALRKVSVRGIIDPAYVPVSAIGIEESNNNIASYIIEHIRKSGVL